MPRMLMRMVGESSTIRMFLPIKSFARLGLRAGHKWSGQQWGDPARETGIDGRCDNRGTGRQKQLQQRCMKVRARRQIGLPSLTAFEEFKQRKRALRVADICETN